MTATAVHQNILQERYDAPTTALGRLMAEAAYYPRVSDDKTAARSRPTEYAIRWPYMQVNRRDFVSWLVFDCDHGDIFRWENASLPPPNLIVSSTKDGRVSSFHLFYAIVPVCTSANARSHPIRYMKAIYAEMKRLLNADQDYYGGPVSKTPGHPWWHTTELHPHEYSLGELNEYFELPRESPQFGNGPELMALTHSRSLTLFEQLRFFAYSVVNIEREKGSFESFSRRLEDYANEINDFERRRFRDPKTGALKGNLALSALRSTIKSVARWTWDHYKGDRRCNRGVMRLDQALPLQERQSRSAERTHSERQKKTEEKVRAACALLLTASEVITQVAIARIAGISRQTVATYQRTINEYLHPALVDAQSREQAVARAPDVKFGTHQIATPLTPDTIAGTMLLQKLMLVPRSQPALDSS